ncbi:unnamed protein product [Oikopleura dioica]|uniref:Amino acid permease/ SLC12A domain-containing protein n=1 Tax=Oikopleura dioica TaxID=34765 RepID=E4Y9Z4_OIKDI|nr:unnamed protein product [Oikopleura dioica]
MKTENAAKVTLKKSVDLKGAVMVIVGCQVGSGIFVSPKGVLEYTNSPGLCLIVWALGGLLAGLGSMVYAELACVIPKSGGEFAFIYHGLPRGKFPAYLFAFTGATILKTATLGIIAITFGDYALKFLSPEFCQYSDNYETAQKLWAILAIATGAAINIFSIEWTQNSVKFFGLGKFISLAAIIIGGIYFAISGKADLSIWSPGNLFDPIYSDKSILTGLGFAFYQAMWSYDVGISLRTLLKK